MNTATKNNLTLYIMTGKRFEAFMFGPDIAIHYYDATKEYVRDLKF